MPDFLVLPSQHVLPPIDAVKSLVHKSHKEYNDGRLAYIKITEETLFGDYITWVYQTVREHFPDEGITNIELRCMGGLNKRKNHIAKKWHVDGGSLSILCPIEGAGTYYLEPNGTDNINVSFNYDFFKKFTGRIKQVPLGHTLFFFGIQCKTAKGHEPMPHKAPSLTNRLLLVGR